MSHLYQENGLCKKRTPGAQEFEAQHQNFNLCCSPLGCSLPTLCDRNWRRQIWPANSPRECGQLIPAMLARAGQDIVSMQAVSKGTKATRMLQIFFSCETQKCSSGILNVFGLVPLLICTCLCLLRRRVQKIIRSTWPEWLSHIQSFEHQMGSWVTGSTIILFLGRNSCLASLHLDGLSITAEEHHRFKCSQHLIKSLKSSSAGVPRIFRSLLKHLQINKRMQKDQLCVVLQILGFCTSAQTVWWFASFE